MDRTYFTGALAAPLACLMLSATPQRTSAQFVEPDVVVIAPLTASGLAAGDNFGWGCSELTDIDADGATDVIIGAPFSNLAGAQAGRAFVFSGRTGALIHQWSGLAGWRLGFSFADAGDVNADGVHDIIIGGQGVPGTTGVARVFSGADGSVLHTIFGQAADDQFGFAVTGLGDLNADGRSEFAVGAPLNDTGGINRGRVYVYSGIDGALLRTIGGQQNSDAFGIGVAKAGDLNNDGRNDLVIGATGTIATRRGKVHVYSALDALQLAPTMIPDQTTGVDLGFFVSGIGDLNADGVEDIYAGDFNDSALGPGTGRAYVFSGATGAEIHRFDAQLPGDGVGPGRGAGDVDGDGVNDLIIGSYTHGSGAAAAGRVRIFSGATGGLLRTITGNQPGETIGFDAVGIGDVNNDCAIDFIVCGSSLNTAYIIAGLPDPCPADADNSNEVGLSDLAVVIAHWAESSPSSNPPGDVNCDRAVGLADIAEIINHWAEVCAVR